MGWQFWGTSEEVGKWRKGSLRQPSLFPVPCGAFSSGHRTHLVLARLVDWQARSTELQWLTSGGGWPLTVSRHLYVCMYVCVCVVVLFYFVVCFGLSSRRLLCMWGQREKLFSAKPPFFFFLLPVSFILFSPHISPLFFKLDKLFLSCWDCARCCNSFHSVSNCFLILSLSLSLARSLALSPLSLFCLYLPAFFFCSKGPVSWNWVYL